MKQIGEKLIENPTVKTCAKYHMRWNCCCYLFSVKTGVYLLAFGQVLGLIEELLVHLNYFRVVLRSMTNAAFFLMWLYDTADTRYIYLNVFVISMPLIALNNLYQYQSTFADQATFGQEVCWLAQHYTFLFGSDKEARDAQPCRVPEDEDDDEEEAECEVEEQQCPILPGGIFKVLFILWPTLVLINIHYAFVLYTHWKNSRLQVKDGGCADQAGPELDMFER